MVPASLVESRSARIAIALTATLAVGGWLLLRGEQPRVLVDQHERARVRVMTAARSAAIAAERCPRPALRTPALPIDGSSLLAGLVDRESPELRCLEQVSSERYKLEPFEGGVFTKLPLRSMPARPELVAACAQLYANIASLAHASEACSPWSTSNVDPVSGPDLPYLSFAFAIKLQVAPLFAAGDLTTAARHITDAMRFSDDYGRKSYLFNAVMAVALVTDLGESLAEILTDPRLTADEARAIARDLDILLASGPTIDAMMRQESRYGVARADEFGRDWPYTGNADQDAVLYLIAIERGLELSEQACRDKPLRACMEARRTQPPSVAIENERDLVQRAVLSGATDSELRERIIQHMVNPWRELAFIPSILGERPFVLAALRMQAELRTMTIDECGDPDARRARLAPWLEYALLGNAPEPTVEAPAWLGPPSWVKSKRPLSRTLRCVRN